MCGVSGGVKLNWKPPRRTRFGLVLLALAGVAAAQDTSVPVTLVAVSARDNVAVVAQGVQSPVLLRPGDGIPGRTLVVSEIRADAILVRSERSEALSTSALIVVGADVPVSIVRPTPGEGADAVVEPATSSASPNEAGNNE